MEHKRAAGSYLGRRDSRLREREADVIVQRVAEAVVSARRRFASGDQTAALGGEGTAASCDRLLRVVVRVHSVDRIAIALCRRVVAEELRKRVLVGNRAAHLWQRLEENLLTRPNRNGPWFRQKST